MRCAIGFIVLYTACLLGIFTAADAELVATRLLDLIEESDLIAIASPLRLEPDSALLRVIAVLKESHDGQPIEIHTSSEVHDQRIRTFDARLLFLKQEKDGGYLGTHYGRSYWPLKRLYSWSELGCTSATPYMYPIATVLLGDVLQTKEIELYVEGLPFRQNPVKMLVICLENVKRLIAEKQWKD